MSPRSLFEVLVGALAAALLMTAAALGPVDAHEVSAAGGFGAFFEAAGPTTVGFTYDFRHDFARPPPVEVASRDDTVRTNLADSAGDLDWLYRAFAVLEPDRSAPNTTTGFRAPATSVNRHGQLTNGSYTVDGVGNAAHQTGNLGSGRSQFLYRVDADSAVLDAAAYADDVGLWGQGVNVHPNQAVVYIENGPVGVLGRSGELTNWIKVTRTDTGFVHGWPASGP